MNEGMAGGILGALGIGLIWFMSTLFINQADIRRCENVGATLIGSTIIECSIKPTREGE